MGDKILKNFSKKCISSLLIFSIIFSLSIPIFLFPKPAKAVIPVVLTFESPGVLVMRSAVGKIEKITVENIIQEVLKVIWEVFRLRVLEYLTNVIVRWIEYGPNDRPQYVTNFREFIGGAIEYSVGKFIEDSNFRFICEPFRFQLRNSLLSLGRPDSVSCTLDLFVSNWTNYWSDFRHGGLMAMGLSTQLNNNYFGNYVNLQNEVLFEAMKAASIQERNVSPGGFINVQRCIFWAEEIMTGEKSCAGGWEIVTPGQAIGDMLTEAVFTKDIKYVISAQEVSAFAAAIINAIMNRLIREGVNGLAGLAESIGRDSEIPPPENVGEMHFRCDAEKKKCNVFFSSPKEDYYFTLEECLEKCGQGEDPEDGSFNDNFFACSAGVFVRGRPSASCSGGVCPRCTGIGGISANDCCFVFCKHSKDVAWQRGPEGVQFSFSDVNPVCSFFGLSTPSNGCLCQTSGGYPFYNNLDVGKFMNNCYDCSNETYFGGNLCKKTTWCEQGVVEEEEEEEEKPEVFVDIKDSLGSDGNITITSGSSVTLNWTSQNVIECTASGKWAGYRNVSGSETFNNITSNSYWTLTCRDVDENIVSDTYNIFVSGI